MLMSLLPLAAAAAAAGLLSAHVVQQLPVRAAFVGAAGTHARKLPAGFSTCIACSSAWRRSASAQLLISFLPLNHESSFDNFIIVTFNNGCMPLV
jgi:hypothetical protein